MTPFDPVASLAAVRHEFGEHGGVNMSIEASTTYTVLDAETMPAIFSGLRGPEQGGCYLYGRHYNPTVYVLGRQLAALEATESGYCTASGMGAIAATLMQRCNSGDHIVASRAVYGGTFALMKEFLPTRAGVETTFVDINDLAAVEGAITPRTKVLYAEVLSNPTLMVADVRGLATLAKRHGATLVVDNTFTPLIFTPARLGADVVVHSATKFISGASDIIAGAICGSHDFMQSLMSLHTGALMLLGPTMDPKIAFELSLRMPHLALRVAEHSRRAMVFAERLAAKGLRVTYPGLATHPHRQRFIDQANPDFGFGGLFTLDVETRARAERLMTMLQNEERFGYMAVSLGYFDTLMSASAHSTSSELSPEDLAKAGISPGLVRVSLGYTGTLEQRWEQLERALARL